MSWNDAAEVGFDAVCVNEHHSTLRPDALAQFDRLGAVRGRTRDTAICGWGILWSFQSADPRRRNSP